MPAVDRRRSDTDSRPMLEPREGLAEAFGVGPVPGADILRGMEEDVEEERDGGREFRSGDIFG